VVDRVRGRDIKVVHDYENKAGAIPLPVTLTRKLGRQIEERNPGTRVSFFSEYPFSWRKDRGPQDDFQKEALVRLEKDPGTPFYRFEKNVNGRSKLRYAVADRMRPQCISCHNNHPDSPKRDWKVGDVRGIIEVSTLGDRAGRNKDILQSTYTVVGIVFLLALIGLLIVSARLRNTALDLDIMVMEKTIELQQANTELEAFSYSVSHDLRSPLTLMKGYGEVLFDQYGPKLDEQGRGLLRKISQATDRMNQMTEDLLNLSRAESLPLRRETIDLSALAASVAEDLSVSQPGRQVEFLVEPGLAAQGDPNLLRLALENLLRNAWKYTGKKPAAKIEFGKTTENGDDVFFIRDNGAGFDMSQADKLFGVFQRLHTAQEFPGTGVGLGTVARIIKRHGGRIWAQAKPGEGATFYFTLA
jgi:signal transduction histidine kinase